MKAFYLFDRKFINLKHDPETLEGKLDHFLDEAIDFGVLMKDYDLEQFSIGNANTTGGIQLAIQNKFFFILNLSDEQERNFCDLYAAYQQFLEKDAFISSIMSTTHPIGKSFELYEGLEAKRLQEVHKDSLMRKRFKEIFTGFFVDAPKILLGEMKHHMQIIPNRSRVRVRYTHFKY